MAQSRTGPTDASGPERWLRIGAVVIAGGLLAAIFIGTPYGWQPTGTSESTPSSTEPWVGSSSRKVSTTARHQLAGPYDVTLMTDVLYPPSALLLFVPFSILPIVLWWVVPIAITGYSV